MDKKRFRIAEIFKSLEQDMVIFIINIYCEFSSKIFFSIDLFSLDL